MGMELGLTAFNSYRRQRRLPSYTKHFFLFFNWFEICPQRTSPFIRVPIFIILEIFFLIFRSHTPLWIIRVKVCCSKVVIFCWIKSCWEFGWKLVTVGKGGAASKQNYLKMWKGCLRRTHLKSWRSRLGSSTWHWRKPKLLSFTSQS